MNNPNKKTDISTYDRGIKEVNISNFCTSLMQIYAANNNMIRHLPFVVDGLKPVERRILFTMFNDVKAYHTGRFRKVATMRGRVLDYHPHGDESIGRTMVKLAQPWNNIECLIEGSGNFGSAMGNGAAAARYIEARLSFYAYKCFFEEFSTDIVDMKLNYTGEKMEPEYLCSKYPNVLINNSFGIGYGISTGIPPYNLKEVNELTLRLIDDPDYEDFLIYPDIPSGASIIDDGQFKEICETGKGKFKMRGEIDIDHENNIIKILSTPLQVNSDNIKSDIIDLIDEGKISGIKDIKDDSGINGIDLKIILKKEIDPLTIVHILYSKTDLEKTLPITYKLIDDYQDYDFNIRELLLLWIDFRRETKRRFYNHKMIEAREKAHILDIILFIFNADNDEKSLALMRKSKNTKEIITNLMNEYKITSLQASTIASMRFLSFSEESYKKFKDDRKELGEKIEKMDSIIRSPKKIDKKIKKDLLEGIELFGKPRRSKIITIDGEVKVRDTNHLVVFTLNGFVKKIPADSSSIGYIAPNDYPIEIIEIRNTSELLIFDESGKISKLPVHQINNSVLTTSGELLNKHCTINGQITAIIPKPTVEVLEKVKQPVYFVMVTKNGVLKKTLAKQYSNIKNELLGMIIKDKDELRSVKVMVGDKDILLYTNKGYGVRIKSSEIKETSRMSIGLKAINLTDNEMVIGTDIVNGNDKYIFALTNKGMGKKCTLDNFSTMERNVKPLRLISLDDSEDVMIIRTVKGNETFKAYLKNSVEEIKIDNVIELPRLSKGKKIIPVRKGEVIIDIKEVK